MLDQPGMPRPLLLTQGHCLTLTSMPQWPKPLKSQRVLSQLRTARLTHTWVLCSLCSESQALVLAAATGHLRWTRGLPRQLRNATGSPSATLKSMDCVPEAPIPSKMRPLSTAPSSVPRGSIRPR